MSQRLRSSSSPRPQGNVNSSTPSSGNTANLRSLFEPKPSLSPSPYAPGKNAPEKKPSVPLSQSPSLPTSPTKTVGGNPTAPSPAPQKSTMDVDLGGIFSDLEEVLDHELVFDPASSANAPNVSGPLPPKVPTLNLAPGKKPAIPEGNPDKRGGMPFSMRSPRGDHRPLPVSTPSVPSQNEIDMMDFLSTLTSQDLTSDQEKSSTDQKGPPLPLPTPSISEGSESPRKPNPFSGKPKPGAWPPVSPRKNNAPQPLPSTEGTPQKSEKKSIESSTMTNSSPAPKKALTETQKKKREQLQKTKGGRIISPRKPEALSAKGLPFGLKGPSSHEISESAQSSDGSDSFSSHFSKPPQRSLPPLPVSAPPKKDDLDRLMEELSSHSTFDYSDLSTLISQEDPLPLSTGNMGPGVPQNTSSGALSFKRPSKGEVTIDTLIKDLDRSDVPYLSFQTPLRERPSEEEVTIETLIKDLDRSEEYLDSSSSEESSKT